jgi:uncharacterized hydantoinase/oxoprolinase family protein
MSDKLREALRRIEHDGFNEVTAWITPAGELVVSLTHRATSDSDVMFRIVKDEDLILEDVALDEYSGDNPDGAWEDESTQLGRLNKGGNW